MSSSEAEDIIRGYGLYDASQDRFALFLGRKPDRQNGPFRLTAYYIGPSGNREDREFRDVDQRRTR